MRNEIIDEIFKDKRCDKKRLTTFGFSPANDGSYEYVEEILNGQFLLTVKIGRSGKIEAEVIEAEFRDKYSLHLVPNATGQFVTSVKNEYCRVLKSIVQNCFVPDYFKSPQSKRVIEHIRKKYGDEPQYLWKKFPANAVFRRSDNAKWYGALLVVPKRKIGLESDGKIDILDLRADEEFIDSHIDGKKYFRGYHMNKRHWITVCMDGSVSMSEIKDRIADSYAIAGKR